MRKRDFVDFSWSKKDKHNGINTYIHCLAVLCGFAFFRDRGIKRIDWYRTWLIEFCSAIPPAPLLSRSSCSTQNSVQ